MTENRRRYKIQMNVYQIGGHIVMTQAKVGTSTCTAIVFNQYKESYRESHPAHIHHQEGHPNPKFYQRIREISTYDVFDEDGKIQIVHLSDEKRRGTREIETFHVPIDKVEEKIIEDVVSTFENIVSGKSKKKIHILCREPLDQWKSAILEDLKYSLHQLKASELSERLKPYFIGTKFEKWHLEILLDYEKEGTIVDKGLFEIDSLYFYMKERVLSAMPKNGKKYKWCTELYKEFKKTYFEALWWQVINPFKSVDGIHDTSTKVILYNMISTHYHPYLTKLWLLFSRVYYPEYVKFVDINQNFGLIKRIGNVREMSNTKDSNVKEAWNMAFFNIANENDLPHLVYLEGEQVIFHTIKDYEKRR
jgi:hypothetical protein